METEEYSLLYKFEEDNWWYKAKRRLIFYYIKKPRKILDVGCGTGIISSKLSEIGNVTSVDYSNDALDFCKKRGLLNVYQASVTELPFEDNQYDLVGCFDVLYHQGVDDEMKAIKELYRVCRKGGYLIFTDSAMKCLWSKHDVSQYARTRYSKKEIREKFKQVGFKIEKLSYYYFFLFPFLFLARKLDNIFNKEGHAKVNVYNTNRVVNQILNWLMLVEFNLVKRINLPFGSTIFCLAKK